MSLFRSVRGFGRASWALVSMMAVAACGSAGSDTSQAVGSTGSGFITGAGGAGGAGGGLDTTTGVTTSATTSASTGGGGGKPAKGAPYPFVLAHGFFGFDQFAGLDFETYFYQVKDHLAAQGEIVATPAVDPFNSSDYRGQQLLEKIQDFLAETGASKVNIIGHSQGGLDARVVANLRPDLVASVVTISTPHHGSPVGDVAMKLLANPNAQQALDDLAQLLGGALYDTTGKQTSLTAALKLFSQPGITAFNQAHPDSPGVFYASISGRSVPLYASGGDCTGDIVLPLVTDWGSTYDAINPLLSAMGLICMGTDASVNDGLVRARDAKWGEYWGCLPADHLDEVGQILGEAPGLGNGWKYLDFYTQLIAYMRMRGF